ncbi:hypothetical protein JMJ77_0000603 [Colletotrichum scovillei]|uniref:Uncharacterized protein n=1 Tax=Colletotrichum scovillei TaxID=1209932 RepID=A0A9P7UKA0_9PEZI|nr:hypothetical protein JMJ77_0000603 [Colletotrichum scovillei]KAG7071811.1 hypothetical protein JMJ76_0004679 [Colletotrichum scovillei]KAG7080090.1 hypothetical protein JMJ78_0007192 [Colletotrichum scovillei]
MLENTTRDTSFHHQQSIQPSGGKGLQFSASLGIRERYATKSLLAFGQNLNRHGHTSHRVLGQNKLTPRRLFGTSVC